MILIGSKALSFYAELNEKRKENSDTDLIMSEKEFFSFLENNESYISKFYPTSEYKYSLTLKNKEGKRKHYEIEISEGVESSQYLVDNKEKVTTYKYTDEFNNIFSVLNLEYLFLMKKSHIIFPIHFEKNIADYLLLKQIAVLKSTKTEKEFFKMRRKEGQIRYDLYAKTPNLNVSNDRFFKYSGVADNRVFVHDDLHEVVKHQEKPIYEYLKRDNEKAWCEKDMFFKLPFEQQIQCVQEEAYVIALERYIIPQEYEYNNYFLCYKQALKRICTNLCSGFFRQFALDNYDKVILAYKEDFVEKFYKAYNEGTLKPMEGRTLKPVENNKVKKELLLEY